jgi:hypothetical protein
VDLIRDDAAKTPIKLHKLRREVSILEGSGGNIAMLTGADGNLLLWARGPHDFHSERKSGSAI